MTESSTEKSETKAVAEGSDEQKVPVAAIAAERAKTRAAKSEAEAANQELAKLKEGQDGGVDLNAIIERLAAENRKLFDAEMASVKQEAANAKLAVRMGLNEAQLNKVVEIGTKNPGLTEAQRLLLAKSEHPDLFPQATRPSWQQQLHGGLPVAGSEQKALSPEEDYAAKLKAAKNPMERQQVAEEHALMQYRNVWLRSKGALV